MKASEKTPVYICDGRKWCGASGDCYMNGGFCKHTKQIEHAKNFREWGRSYEECAAGTKPAALLKTITFALMLLNLIQYLRCYLLNKGQKCT